MIQSDISMNTREILVIVDLEATCCDAGSFPREEMEILETGAVAVERSSAEVRSTFQSFVRPVRHPKLTEFCMTLTTITQADVDNADTFPEVCERLSGWLAQFESHVFCSWGDYDRKQVDQDCRFHGVQRPLSSRHRNLKREFSEAMNSKKRFGVGSALRRLGLEFEGTAHRGIDDAINIGRIYAAALARLD